MKIFNSLLASAALILAAQSAGASTFSTTELVDGQFAADTPWYTLQIGASGLYVSHTEGASYYSLSNIESEYADTDLWCLVGDDATGYKLYNKAAGPGKALASPTNVGSDGNTGGSSYPIVQTEGSDSYIYTWHFVSTTDLGTDTPAFYMYPDGQTSWKVNNRNGIFAYWTGGADSGSALQVLLAEQTVELDATSSTIDAAGSTLTHSAFPTVALGSSNATISFDSEGHAVVTSGTWKFTAPEGYYVEAYKLEYVLTDASATGTLRDIDDEDDDVAEIGGGHGANGSFAIEGIEQGDEAEFTFASEGSTLTLSKLTVTIRRNQPVHLGTVVFRYDGTSNYNIVYRIPAITTIENGPNKGRVLAINDYRYSGADIGNGRIDLYQAYSADNGETWTTPDHMRDSAGSPVAQGTGVGTLETSLQNPDCGFGDPAMVSDRESGKVLVMSVCGRTPFWSGRRDNPNQVARWYSEDGGDSWTHFDNITEQIYSLFDGTVPFGYIDSMFFGSGKICQSRQVKVGAYYRLYAVLSGYNATAGNVSNWVLYSDDFGQNWAILGDPMQPAVSASGDEPKAEELPDGSVLLAARSSAGGRNFNIFHYTDIAAATGTWGNSVNTNCGASFTINACNGEILIVPAKNVETGKQCYLALQSLTYNSSRINVSILWKVLDEGADIISPSAFTQWDGRLQVTNLSSAYSTMTLQHDHNIGFIYEEATYGKAYCEVYRNISIEELTDGAYTYSEDTDNAFAKQLTVEAVDARVAELPAEGGKYVGEYTAEAVANIKASADAYKTNPSTEAYIAFNRAVASTENVISIQPNGLYRIISAHNGTYSSITTPRYLSASNTQVTVTATDSENNYYALLQKTGSSNWILYNPAKARYIAASPATSNVFTVNAKLENAKEYSIASSTNGYSNITCVDSPTNANYASLHMDSSQRVVAWTSNASASQWYLELMGEGENLPNPDGDDEDAITEIDAAGGNAEVQYFDLLGRPVASPRRGNLYITSDRKKLVL
jgi:hypothetical protein